MACNAYEVYPLLFYSCGQICVSWTLSNHLSFKIGVNHIFSFNRIHPLRRVFPLIWHQNQISPCYGWMRSQMHGSKRSRVFFFTIHFGQTAVICVCIVTLIECKRIQSINLHIFVFFRSHCVWVSSIDDTWICVQRLRLCEYWFRR